MRPAGQAGISWPAWGRLGPGLPAQLPLQGVSGGSDTSSKLSAPWVEQQAFLQRAQNGRLLQGTLYSSSSEVPQSDEAFQRQPLSPDPESRCPTEVQVTPVTLSLSDVDPPALSGSGQLSLGLHSWT